MEKPKFVSKEVADSDRAAQEVALYDASEKLMYANILNDDVLRQQATEDMAKAREMRVRFTEESYNRVKDILMRNDPEGSYAAGLIAEDELAQAIARVEG
jgi:hypothetical protein